ncbi:MAG: DUF971 domain-containing protein [Sphingomonadales bacterium]|jgi:DUF971 family protein
MSAWPEDIHYDSGEKQLHISFDDGSHYAIPAELLRVESPSAEVQGHSPSQKQIVPGKADVTITDIEAVGNYAIRLTFSDGHNSGIYTWNYLAELGADKEAKLNAYYEALKTKGLGRN